MTAAVYAARKRLDAVLISKDLGGQAMWTGRVENYMGYQYIEGFELMSKFEEQVKQFPLEQKIGSQAVSLRRIDGGFEVKTDSNERYQAKAAIIATGKRPRSLNGPGEERLSVQGLFIAIGHRPNSAVFRDWLVTDEKGYLRTDGPTTAVPVAVAARASIRPSAPSSG